jgi:hypothetical protein
LVLEQIVPSFPLSWLVFSSSWESFFLGVVFSFRGFFLFGDFFFFLDGPAMSSSSLFLQN